MKKIIALLMVVSLLTSCEENVSFNTPAFQARKDNFMWRASSYSAVYDVAQSSLQLTAQSGFEKVTITVSPVVVTGDGTTAFFQDATFDLKNNTEAIATYDFVNNGQTYSYTTEVEDIANGELVLKNGAVQKPGTVSGAFRFDAPYQGDIPNAPERINFQEGVFYEIPLTFAPIL